MALKAKKKISFSPERTLNIVKPTSPIAKKFETTVPSPGSAANKES